MKVARFGPKVPSGKSMEEDSAKPKNRQWCNMFIILLCFVQGCGCENCMYSFGALHPACGVKGFGANKVK